MKWSIKSIFDQEDEKRIPAREAAGEKEPRDRMKKRRSKAYGKELLFATATVLVASAALAFATTIVAARLWLWVRPDRALDALRVVLGFPGVCRSRRRQKQNV